MNRLATPSKRRKRVGAGIVLGTVVLASLGGAYAYRTIFARPGESALKYIPADAAFVMSIDLSPSPTQALVFKHIDDALSRNGLERFSENSILEAIDHNPATDELKPLIQRSGAGCVDVVPGKNGSDEYSGLLLISLSDGAQALDILKKNCQVQFFKGLRYYTSNRGHFDMMVVDDLLVMSNQPSELLKVKEIKEGARQSITSVPEFVAAREKVASDANVLAFASPKIWASLVKNQTTSTPDWLAMGVAVREGGIGLSMAVKTDMEKNPAMKGLLSVPPVRTDLFDVMPTGSYGMFAMSDPSAMFDLIESEMQKNKDTRKVFQEMEDSSQKGIGLSVKDDLAPAMKGDAVIAAYPAKTGDADGVELLAIVDDHNGANPAAAVERFQSFMDRQMSKEGNEPKLFVSKSIDGGVEYRINDKYEQDMRKSLGNGLNPEDVDKDVLVGKKTVAYAIVDKTVIASTSQDLLDRAVASYRSKTNGLTGDAKFEPAEKTVLDGSQTMMMFSVSRIAEGIKNTARTTHMDPEAVKLMATILDAVQSLKEPLYAMGKATQDGTNTAGFFIPMDYDKLIDIIGGQMKKH